MTFTLYGYDNNPRSQIVLVTAFLEGVDIELSKVVPRNYIGTDAYIAKFPLSKGKIPGLEGPGIKIHEVIAISTYVASLSNKAKLLGDTKEQTAEVTQWMSWLNMEFLNTIARWFLPLVPNLKRPAAYNAQAVADGKRDSLKVLSQLEDLFSGLHRQYLVGDHLTLADIFFVIYLARGFEWVLDASWRAAHPNLMRYFEHKAAMECFRRPIMPFSFIEKETPNVDPYAANFEEGPVEARL